MFYVYIKLQKTEMGNREEDNSKTREILVDCFLLQPHGWVRLGKKTQAQYHSSVYTKRQRVIMNV